MLLRLYGLGDKPFWLDEVTSLRRATSSLPDLVADSLHHTHYPTYFLLLWLVAKLGASQWLLRFPSALCGALAAALAAIIGRKIWGWRAGAITGLLLALSPFEVQFGQEARSYTLVCCLILTALWGLVALAQQPMAAARPLNRKGALPGAWLAYVLGTAAALNVLNVALPWLIAANIGAFAIACRAGQAKRGFLRHWIIAQLLVLASWIPLLVAVYISRNGTLLDAADWVPAGTTRTIWSIIAPVYLLRISSFITFDLMPAPMPWLGLALVAAAAYGAWELRRRPVMLAILGAAAMVLPLGLGLISLFVPVLVPRYFAWGAAPFFIFAGIGLDQLSKRRFAVLVVSLVAICLINLEPYYGYETKPRWDLLAKKLAQLARPGDVVLLHDYEGYLLLAAFAASAGLDEHQVKLTCDMPEAKKIAPGHDIWAVYGRTGQGARQSVGNYQQSLAGLGQPAVENSVGRYIVFWRFVEPNGPGPAALNASPRDPADLSWRDQPTP